MQFFFLFLIFVFFLAGSRLAYIAVFASCTYGFFYLLRSSEWRVRLLSFSRLQVFIFLLPLFVFLTWVYGVLLGLSNGVPVEYVFLNFAGMAVYLSFYIFFFWMNAETSRKALFLASLVVSVFAICSVAERVLGGGYMISGDSISSGRVVFSGSFLYVVPFLFMYLLSLLPGECGTAGGGVKNFPVGGFKGFIIFIVFSFTLLVPALSKGYIMVYGMVLAIFFIAGALSALLTGRTNFVFVFIFLSFLIAVISVFLWTDFFDLIIFSLSSKEESNSIRSEQFGYLLDEWSFQGAGLGSSLMSGYTRDETGYGFELTYINIVNKIGVFAIPLFVSYLIPVLYGLKNILTPGKRVAGGWVLGLMAYLIPGAANPILLAPEFVVMHFIALMSVIWGVGRRDGSNDVIVEAC